MRHAYIKKEGAALHPDAMIYSHSDKSYEEQLRKYLNDTGDNLADLYCSRAAIKLKLMEEHG